MKTIPVALVKGEKEKPYPIHRIEELLGFQYVDQLLFDNWTVEQWVKKKCSKAYKEDKIGTHHLWLGKMHQRQIQQAKIPDIALRWVGPEVGYGIFATKTLKKWAYVGEYTGLLRRRNLFFPNVNDYCFQYPREWLSLKALTIDSEKHGNYTRFINHSDNPNCESVSVLYEGAFHVIFRTLREIPAGTQLTYDYGDVYWKRRTKLPDPISTPLN